MEMRLLPLAGLVFVLLSARAQAEDLLWIWHGGGAPPQARDLAVLLDHLRLSGAGVEVRHRTRRLVLPATTRVTPVVHVQTDPASAAQWNMRQLAAIVDAVTAAAAHSNSGWVQLDFEPADSERERYLNLVGRLRRTLPASIRLSVTVMAAWCGDHEVLGRIAADEVVPMFFRMGVDAQSYRRTLLYTPERLDRRCRGDAAGFAIQEPPPDAVRLRYARRYWFNYANWDAGANGFE